MRSGRLMQISFVLGGVSPFIEQLLGRLQAEAMVCHVISGLSELLRFVRQYPPIIVIEEGFAQMRLEEFVRRIRQYTTNPLAILLPDRKDEVRRLILLEMGVDQILDPSRPSVATSRLLALRRRHLGVWPITEERIERGPLVILPKEYVVEVRGQNTRMTKKEFELLLYLAQNDRAVPRSELEQVVWRRTLGDSRTLDVHVGRLRQRIERDPHHPELLQTIPNIGYALATGS